MWGNGSNLRSNEYRRWQQDTKISSRFREDHPVHLALTKFAKTVEESSEGHMKVEIFSNGVLGNEREMLEQIQGGE